MLAPQRKSPCPVSSEGVHMRVSERVSLAAADDPWPTFMGKSL